MSASTWQNPADACKFEDVKAAGSKSILVIQTDWFENSAPQQMQMFQVIEHLH